MRPRWTGAASWSSGRRRRRPRRPPRARYAARRARPRAARPAVRPVRPVRPRCAGRARRCAVCRVERENPSARPRTPALRAHQGSCSVPLPRVRAPGPHACLFDRNVSRLIRHARCYSAGVGGAGRARQDEQHWHQRSALGLVLKDIWHADHQQARGLGAAREELGLCGHASDERVVDWRICCKARASLLGCRTARLARHLCRIAPGERQGQPPSVRRACCGATRAQTCAVLSQQRCCARLQARAPEQARTVGVGSTRRSAG